MKRLNSFIMILSCPRCESQLEAVNIGDPVDGGTATCAVVRCMAKGCQLEFSVHVHLMPLGVVDDDGEDHGTSRGLYRHKKRGESPCDECMAHEARQVADRKQARTLVDA